MDLKDTERRRGRKRAAAITTGFLLLAGCATLYADYRVAGSGASRFVVANVELVTDATPLEPSVATPWLLSALEVQPTGAGSSSAPTKELPDSQRAPASKPADWREAATAPVMEVRIAGVLKGRYNLGAWTIAVGPQSYSGSSASTDAVDGVLPPAGVTTLASNARGGFLPHWLRDAYGNPWQQKEVTFQFRCPTTVRQARITGEFTSFKGPAIPFDLVADVRPKPTEGDR